MLITRYPTTKPFPFSDMVASQGFLFLSGQVSMTAEGEPVYGTVTEQTLNIMHAVTKTLNRAGASLNDVVRVQVWLSDMKYFAEFNRAYGSFFHEIYPSRTVTSSTLAFGMDVEIEIQATNPGNK